LWQNAKICQWPANFWAINENQDSFKDWKNDYIFAYTEPVTVQWWDWTSRNVEFLQWAITLENGTNKVVWNYYTENEDDTSGLVLDTDWEPITDWWNGNVATPPWNTDEENTPTNCTENANCSDWYSCNAWSCVANSCAVQPNYEHATFIEWTPTQINQAWAQWTSGWCYYQCTDWYTWENCEQEPLILSSNCISKWQILTITWSYFTNTEATRAMAWLSNPSCDTPDIMVCIWAWTWMTLATCNVWANVANNTICTSQANCSIERAWLYFQWWNNYGSTIWWPTSSERPDTVTNPYTSIAFIIWNQDWVQTQNDDLWGNITNTNEARQWPCPSWRHVPIATEWEKIASTIDADGYNFSLVANTLSLPKAWYRTYSNGAITFSAATECNDSAVCYWSSSITSSNRPIYLHEYCWETWVDSYNNSRADGCSVRCIKD
jgi:hypothetical protein